MAITIAEAARQWQVARETIYRRQLAGEMEFATIDPPTVDASEMLRAFGEPKAAADKPAATDVVALTRIEAICEALKAAAEYLMAELATMKKELQAEREQTRNERDRLLEFLGVQKRLLETSETSKRARKTSHCSGERRHHCSEEKWRRRRRCLPLSNASRPT